MKSYYKNQKGTIAKKKNFYHSIKWAKTVAIFFFIVASKFIPLKTKKPNPKCQSKNNYKKCHFKPLFFGNYIIKKGLKDEK
ncbi:MAG: hypothetical protein MR902_07555 [Campylobacter sp.]|nr:hypothetical protein [Campylobacter sp.]